MRNLVEGRARRLQSFAQEGSAMLQDLTKSALSFSWAISLLTMKQAAGLMRPDQRGSNMFAPLAQAAADQLDDSMKNLYRSGDSVQRRGVDLAFSLLDPSLWTNAGTQAGMNVSGAANAGMPSSSAQLWNLMNLANPLTWMNRIMSMPGMQSCGPCRGDGTQRGSQL
jgi:hypothetical protein